MFGNIQYLLFYCALKPVWAKPPLLCIKFYYQTFDLQVIDEAIDESIRTDISASASGAMLKLDLSKKDEPKDEDKTSATPRTGEFK